MIDAPLVRTKIDFLDIRIRRLGCMLTFMDSLSVCDLALVLNKVFYKSNAQFLFFCGA